VLISCETSSQTAYLRRTKTAYRVKNWHEYDQSLRARGDITLWISQAGAPRSAELE
jgi:hypothetical protein